MKEKLIAATIVVLLLIGFCVFDEIYVEHTFKTFTAMLIEEEEKATFDLAEMETLNKWWETTHQKLEVIVPHTQLNEITFAFGELLGTIRADDVKSAEGQLRRLIETSRAMQEMFSINWGNLF